MAEQRTEADARSVRSRGPLPAAAAAQRSSRRGLSQRPIERRDHNQLDHIEVIILIESALRWHRGPLQKTTETIDRRFQRLCTEISSHSRDTERGPRKHAAKHAIQQD